MKNDKCRYIEGNQSSLKAFALRVFGQMHEVKAQKQNEIREEKTIYREG